ncbi:unnamed protein product [Enterobius vermicularis]|uniref:Uncharacterized protein n=1 Tax=Enterobius vermicularis TaxID=51028 RepID=A0A0N4V2Z4_ENTVE|nr:unnamed protein product [Enterobius vermicularis]
MATEFYQQKNPYYVRYSGYMKYPYSDYKQPFMSYYSKSLGPIGGMAEDRNNRDRYSHFRVEYPGIMNPVENGDLVRGYQRAYSGWNSQPIQAVFRNDPPVAPDNYDLLTTLSPSRTTVADYSISNSRISVVPGVENMVENMNRLSEIAGQPESDSERETEKHSNTVNDQRDERKTS